MPVCFKSRLAIFVTIMISGSILFCLVSCSVNKAEENREAIQGPVLSSSVTPAVTDNLVPADSDMTTSFPDPLPPAAEGIRVPNGFHAYTYADGFEDITALAFDPEGNLVVAERDGAIKIVSDNDGDGVGEGIRTLLAGFSNLLGIAYSPDGVLYASHEATISRLADTNEDGHIDLVQAVLSDLPQTVLHLNNNIIFGPDGKFYVGNGSTCNDCVEIDDRSAAILRANPDGSNLETYASGLRNVYDMAFSETGELWATENGADPPCNQPDELNLIVQGAHYGWPSCAQVEAGDLTSEGVYIESRGPVVELGLNVAPTGITVYESDQFPADYSGDLFIALWGGIHRTPGPAEGPIGRKLVRVEVKSLSNVTGGGMLDEGAVEDFAIGFKNPIDVIVDDLGTLFVADFSSGKVYRIIWTG